MSHNRDYSDDVAAKVDGEVRKLITSAHETASAILLPHRPVLDKLAGELVERETLDTPDLLEIFGHLPVWDGVPPPAKANGNGATTRRRRTTRSAPST